MKINEAINIQEKEQDVRYARNTLNVLVVKRNGIAIAWCPTGQKSIEVVEPAHDAHVFLARLHAQTANHY